MSIKVEMEIEKFKRHLLDERIGRLTEEQKANFAKIFPNQVPANALLSAIDLCDRTIANNEAAGVVVGLDKTGKLDDETVKVIQMILFQLYPPTNPAVVLLAARNWYLEYGGGAVLKACVDWLFQLTGFSVEPDTYHKGQAEFLAKTKMTEEEVAALAL